MRAVCLRLLAACALLGLAPSVLAAQQATLVSGAVTSEAGQPLASVLDLLALGPDVEVLHPPQLRAQLARAA